MRKRAPVQPSVVRRHEIIEALRSALDSCDAVRGAWLGGSDATGRTDALSDIDLVAIARDEQIGEVFALVERALRERSEIELRFEVPRPTWHGHDQVFYKLAKAPPECLIDLAVIRASSPRQTWFLESERHGDAMVLVDRDGLLEPVPMDRPTHESKMRARLEALKTRFGMFQCLVDKAIARGLAVEASAFYSSFSLQPLVEVLRMLHCPDRYDFGMRYLERDLPPQMYRTVERLAFYGNLEQLRARQEEAGALFKSTLRALER